MLNFIRLISTIPLFKNFFLFYKISQKLILEKIEKKVIQQDKISYIL